MGTNPGAVLITRAWPKKSALAAFDEWQKSRHLQELAGLPGLMSVSYYLIREAGIPQVWQGSGNRMAAYWAEDVGGLRRWMADPGLANAIKDGSKFFNSFNELDGETYTGNVYDLGPRWPGDAEPTLSRCLLIQRFEVDTDDEREFDEWVVREHLPALRTVADVGWAQYGTAVRGLSVPYYNSAGNRIVMVEVDGEPWPAHPLSPFERPIRDSQRWDRRLEYVRREINEPVAVFGTERRGGNNE